MSDSDDRSPENVPASNDPGDDTASRYEFQYAYAAIMCCILLDDTQSIEEVLCEHHEDVVLRHADGTYSGLQIKTRATDQPVWKTSDDGVRNACTRFAAIEAEFPGRFREFRFLTNHPLHSAENGKDLRYVLNSIRSAASLSDLSGRVLSFLKRAASSAGCSDAVAYTALGKASAYDDLPKLRDVEARLISDLTSVWNRAADCSYGTVERAAKSIIGMCREASSLAHERMLRSYLAILPDPVEAELTARLAAKKITVAMVIAALDRAADETAPLIARPGSVPEPGGGATPLLFKKLDAGGFSVVSRNSAEDLRDKSDYLALVWIQKHGRPAGLQRYEHVRSLVLSDAANAFETAKSETAHFGPQMLQELRGRIRSRRGGDSQLYDCSDEHLEGISYSLTSECVVQWSVDRPWEDDE